MKLFSSLKRTSVASICLVLSYSAFAASPADLEKLKELERAMGAAPVEHAIGTEGNSADPTKKKRTRAIVFDADPAQESNVTPKPAVVASNTRIQDCQQPPADARITPVDFAIQFKSGSADIAPASEDTLVQIAKILSLSPDKCIMIEGHSDASGNPNANMVLSRDRANSVFKFITDKAGMDTTRIQAVGKGQTEPLKNLDPRDPKNRRVVFKVVG